MIEMAQHIIIKENHLQNSKASICQGVRVGSVLKVVVDVKFPIDSYKPFQPLHIDLYRYSGEGDMRDDKNYVYLGQMSNALFFKHYREDRWQAKVSAATLRDYQHIPHLIFEKIDIHDI